MYTTIEKMRLDADRFCNQWGLENEGTIALYSFLEETEIWLPESVTSALTEAVWNKLYSYWESVNYQKLIEEENPDELAED